ncbi:D-arabinono-1,4-lactone oxidase [Streptomyces sp. NPDC056600]|uniref:D-arabinono-1,4-lactone oxidase n=1 Tax=Streptomyces sp. NPDC056600 TaxID=3345874 RepID=UPI0036799C3A
MTRIVCSPEVTIKRSYESGNIDGCTFRFSARVPARHAVGAEVPADGAWTNFPHRHGSRPRPHRSKWHTLEAAELRGPHPRWDDFTALRGELDPTGLFGSPAVDRVPGGV